MPGMMDNVNTLNSVVRTFLALALLGGAGIGGLIAYRTYHEGDIAKANLEQTRDQLADAQHELKSAQTQLGEKEQQLQQSQRDLRAKDKKIASLNITVDEQKQLIQRQATAMRLLKNDQRLAVITVIGQEEVDGQLTTTVSWVEVNEQNEPIEMPRKFTLQGDIVKVDAWIVKFDDAYIEQADLIRGTSICLFRRIHGEFPKREEVHSLDRVGTLPSAYRHGQISDFEREVWDDFWEIANNPDRAEQLGIRAAHGEVVYNKVRPGKRYKLELRASGGLTMKPLADNEPGPVVKPPA